MEHAGALSIQYDSKGPARSPLVYGLPNLDEIWERFPSSSFSLYLPLMVLFIATVSVSKQFLFTGEDSSVTAEKFLLLLVQMYEVFLSTHLWWFKRNLTKDSKIQWVWRKYWNHLLSVFISAASRRRIMPFSCHTCQIEIQQVQVFNTPTWQTSYIT